MKNYCKNILERRRDISSMRRGTGRLHSCLSSERSNYISIRRSRRFVDDDVISRDVPVGMPVYICWRFVIQIRPLHILEFQVLLEKSSADGNSSYNQL